MPYTLIMDVFLKEIKFEAEYNFSGRILLLPIVGSGNALITFSKVFYLVVVSSIIFHATNFRGY